VFHTGGVLLAAGLGVVLALLGGPARSSPKVV